MKKLFNILIAVGLLAGFAQAGLIVDCATLVGNTGKGPFTGKDHTTHEAWALGVIADKGFPAPGSPFSKVDTSDRTVMLTSADEFIMLHWGNGGIGENAYQLYYVGDCEPGEHTFRSPRRSGEGLSWVGRLGGGGGKVPDGGTSLILMGLALCGLGPVRKLLSK